MKTIMGILSAILIINVLNACASHIPYYAVDDASYQETVKRFSGVPIYDAENSPGFVVQKAPPKYPKSSREMRSSRTIILQALIDEAGEVTAVVVVDYFDRSCALASIDAAKASTFHSLKK
jgi:hypothetical protein